MGFRVPAQLQFQPLPVSCGPEQGFRCPGTLLGRQFPEAGLTPELFQHLSLIHIYMAPRMFPLAAYESVSREIERRITQKGVQLALGSALASVEETGDGFVCSMTDGSTVQADLIVLCIGTRTNVSLVDPAEVTVNKGIVVDHDMQTSVPGVYAAGCLLYTSRCV